MYDLINEIKKTYADNQNDGKRFDETEKVRRLDWESEVSVRGWHLGDALRAIGEGYNEFEPIKITDIIITVDPEAEVYVAREGSVCLYIRTTKPEQMIKALDADEGDIQSDGLVRIWWD